MKLLEFGQIDERDKFVHDKVLELQDTLRERRKTNLVFKTERDELDKKLSDLQKFNVKSMMASITMTKVSKVDKLKKSLYDINQKISQDDSEINECLIEIERLRKEENQLTIDRGRVKQFRQLLHDQLLHGEDDQSLKYQELYKVKEEIDDEKREVYEALSAGKRASRACDAALDCLGGARKWATYDALGGGALAGMEKRDCVNEAKECIEKVYILMEKFKKELDDVDASVMVKKLSKLQKSVKRDIYRDGLFNDLRTFSLIVGTGSNISDIKVKIDEALEGVETLYTGVEEISNNQNQVISDFINNIEFDEDDLIDSKKI